MHILNGSIRAVVAAALLLSVPALAQTTPNQWQTVQSRVTDVGTNGNSSIYVIFEHQIASCTGTKNNRIRLPANHAARDNVYAVAIAALTSGRPARIHPALCDSSDLPLFDETQNSWLSIVWE